MGITIVGLGPGAAHYLTREAWGVLESAETLFLRTERHPTIADLPAGVAWQSFDALYETLLTFGDVYEAIIETIVTQGQQKEIVYAVPGHPFVGEATVTGIVQRATAQSIAVKVVAGLSFVEPTLQALGVDLLEGVQIVDAIELAQATYPQINPDMPLLLSQVYSQMLATDVKLALADLYGDEHEVVLVHSAGNADQRVEALALFEIDRTPHVAHLTSLYVPPRPAVGSLSGFAESIAVLRGPDGCPWDREQTPQSLRAGLLEEVAEALDALDRDDNDALADELGDVLLHIVMQAQMAAEAGYFTLTDVIAGIDAKIKRRHPHVWGDTAVGTSGEVEDNWAAIKALEKGRNQSPTILENIPLALPALARSQKIQSRVRKVGFDWPDISGVWEKLHEEVTELVSAETPEHRREELGDLLFVIVNLAKWLDIDAEVALREANAKFERRFRAVEQLVAERGLSMESLDLPMLETLWTQIKANER